MVFSHTCRTTMHWNTIAAHLLVYLFLHQCKLCKQPHQQYQQDSVCVTVTLICQCVIWRLQLSHELRTVLVAQSPKKISVEREKSEAIEKIKRQPGRWRKNCVKKWYKNLQALHKLCSMFMCLHTHVSLPHRPQEWTGSICVTSVVQRGRRVKLDQ